MLLRTLGSTSISLPNNSVLNSNSVHIFPASDNFSVVPPCINGELAPCTVCARVVRVQEATGERPQIISQRRGAQHAAEQAGRGITTRTRDMGPRRGRNKEQPGKGEELQNGTSSMNVHMENNN
jgi:hypothetical protein